MKPAAFEYERPTTIDEALSALRTHGENAKILAGGQSLIPMMNLRLVQPSRIIDLGDLHGLRGISEVGNEIRIGALTTHNTLLTSAVVEKHCPLLVESYHEVAHHSVRNRGTLGGSLCHNDPAAEMPLIMSVLGSTMVVKSTRGERLIHAEEFLVGAFTTSLDPDELLIEIRIPIPAAGHGYAFLEVAQRKGDFGLVACAAMLSLRNGRCHDVRIGYGSLGTDTARMKSAESILEGQEPNSALFTQAGVAAASDSDPPADLHASSEYRKDITRVVTERVLARAVDRARGSNAKSH